MSLHTATPNEKAQLRSQLGFLDGSNANCDPKLLFFEGFAGLHRLNHLVGHGRNSVGGGHPVAADLRLVTLYHLGFGMPCTLGKSEGHTGHPHEGGH